MKTEKIFVFLIIIFLTYNYFKSDFKESMTLTHIPNMYNLQKYTNVKFPHFNKNQTYYDKIEKPQNDLDNYFSFKNYNKNESSDNKLTTSEIENTYFFQKFNSSINNEKHIINPKIDDFSESRFYVKNIKPDQNVYERLYNKYTNEGVINGGNFMENISGIEKNYKSDYSKF